MKKEKLDLETIFKIADKDKSNGIELIELKTQLSRILTAEDAKILFEAVDTDKSNSISYEELMHECQKLHCGFVME